jgi:hypothetical protein
MNSIQLALVAAIFHCSGYAQEEEKSAHLSLKIRNEKGEVFKGSILLIANNDSIPVTASWNNLFRADLLPGTYHLVVQNKLFDNYVIDSLKIDCQETKELEITWPHRKIVLPQIVFHL